MSQPIGKVTHYYDHLGVAVVDLTQPLHQGDKVHFHGPSTDFDQTVASMQLDHESIDEAKPGQEFGLKVDQPVSEGDVVSQS